MNDKDNTVYYSVYDFCRCSQVGDIFKMIHTHRGCRYDKREFVAIKDVENTFKIIMDSANGKHNGRTLPRTMFSDYYTFQKLYND